MKGSAAEAAPLINSTSSKEYREFKIRKIVRGESALYRIAVYRFGSRSQKQNLSIN
jgi:hypothetical protein